MPDLDEQLRTWTDQAEPITAEEARTRASEPVIPFSTDRRHRGVFGSPGRRLLVAAAVVLVVAGGVFAATQVGDNDEVRVGEQPQQPDPTPAPDPTQPAPDPTEAPTDPEEPVDDGSGSWPDLPVLDGPITPATLDGAPPFWLGHDADQRLVAVDTRTGEVVQVVAQFNRGEGDDEALAGAATFLADFDLAPDRVSVFASMCCEPVSGAIVPLSLDETTVDEPDLWPRVIGPGYEMEFSPDGTRVAIIGYEDLAVVDLVTDESWSYPHRSPGATTTSAVAWSRDGQTIYAAQEIGEGPGAEQYEILEVEPGRTATLDAATVVHVTDVGELLTDLSVDVEGNVQAATKRSPGPDQAQGLWVGPGRVTTIDPGSSTVVAVVEHQGTVLSQHHGTDGTWVLLSAADGAVHEVTGESLTIVVLHDGVEVGRHDGFHSASW